MSQVLRRRWLDLLLLAAALALVALVVLTTGRVTTGEARSRAQRVLPAYREDELRRITIEREGTRLVLERSVSPDSVPVDDTETPDYEWRIVEPRQEDSGAFEVQELLTALDQAQWVRRIEAGGEDRATMGLDQPRLVVRIEMGAIDYRLVFGREAVSPPGSVYLELGGDGAPGLGVGLVRRTTLEHLDLSLDDLREPKLVPYLSDALSRAEIETGKDTLRLRREGPRWRFDGMRGGRRVERARVESFFAALVQLSAEEVLAVNRARSVLLGQEKVRITLVPTDRGHSPAVLEVGGSCPGSAGRVVALRLTPAPLAGCVEADTSKALHLLPAELEMRRLVSLNPDEIESLSIRHGETRLELVRTENGFRLQAPRQEPVTLELGNQRVGAIASAQGTLVEDPDLRTLGLSPPQGRLTVTSAGATEGEVVTEVVELGTPQQDGQRALRRIADGAVLNVGRDAARAFLPDATLMRSLQIFDFEAKDVRSLTTTGTVSQRLIQAAAGQVELEEPKGLMIDAALASDLLQALASLEANRWVADRDDGSFGLEDPSLRVIIRMAATGGAETEHHLVVGARTAGGVFAQRGGDDGVFVLPRRVHELLTRWLVDRSACVVNPDRVRRLEVETRDGSVELIRGGEGWEQVGGTVSLPADHVWKLVEGLSALRAEAAVTIGAPRPEEGLSRPVLVVRVEAETQESGAREIRFGASDSWGATSIHYARASGVNATFVVAQSKVRQVTDLF